MCHLSSGSSDSSGRAGAPRGVAPISGQSGRAACALLVLLAAAAASCGDNLDAEVSVSGVHAVAVGQTVQLSAVTVGASDRGYTWAIEDTAVAQVNGDGAVTGVAAGETTVVVRGADTGLAARHAIVVAQPVVLLTGVTVVEVGSTTALSATTVNGADDGYAWTTSDETVATVDAGGVVTGVADGQAVLTATGSATGAAGSAAVIVTASVPNYQLWKNSGHANREAEAFRHWDEEDPREIPTTCARCHSAPGFRDFIGEDGSAPDVVDAPAAIGSVIDCGTCHNATADRLSAVTFPSGVTITGLGPEARCMTCHQGRSSTETVKADIAAAAVGDDEVSAALHFVNIHYYAAGATLEAGRVRGGYQYSDELGAVYDFRFRHAPGIETCTGCHDPHSLQVQVSACQECHGAVQTVAQVRNIRQLASRGSDYDGDGDLTEGIFYEVEGLRGLLLAGIQGYARDQGLSEICYDAAYYPYFFRDGDGDGACSAQEATYANAFAQWTPRLLKAAYNFQVATKDPGAFAHNAKYIIQLLHDSITDLNAGLTTPIDLSGAVRNDPGHFNGAAEAARHWDEDDEVSASCSRCHGGSEGFRFFVEFGVGRSVEEQDNGLDCATCHDNLSTTYATVPVDAILFPGDRAVGFPDEQSNMCGTCHAGRESKATVDAALAAGQVRFRNVHYLPAAAVKLGADAQVGYEYPGKTYAVNWDHAPGDACTFCHDPALSQHSFDVRDNFGKCTNLCHTTQAEPADIRGNPFFAGALHAVDYDGDGSSTERLEDELADLADALLAEIQAVAAAGGQPLCYSGDSYPYFFRDTNGNAVCDGAEADRSNGFSGFTPALVKATFNYQLYQKEPGAWAHNFDYTAQLLIDSIEDLGGSGAVAGFIRP